MGDLLESLGLKEKSTEMGRRESDGSKPGARVDGLFPPYFFFPTSDSTQSLDSRDGDAPPRRLDVTAATIAIEEKLVEKVGVGFSHAKEIAEEVLEPRRNRINPRVIKKKMSNWPKKRPEHRLYPQPNKEFREAIRVLN